MENTGVNASIGLAGSLLNEAQRRHLAVTLESVDRALSAVVEAHAPRAAAGQLRQWVDDVPADIRSGLAARGLKVWKPQGVPFHFSGGLLPSSQV